MHMFPVLLFYLEIYQASSAVVRVLTKPLPTEKGLPSNVDLRHLPKSHFRLLLSKLGCSSLLHKETREGTLYLFCIGIQKRLTPEISRGFETVIIRDGWSAKLIAFKSGNHNTIRGSTRRCIG